MFSNTATYRRHTHSSVPFAFRFLLGAVGVAASFPAASSLITLSGGFTGFSGSAYVAPNASRVNGIVVPPDVGSVLQPVGSAYYGVGSLSFNGAQSIVNFEETNFSGVYYPSNTITFTPSAQQDVTVGSQFTIGTFTVTNGVWTDYADFPFTVTMQSSDPTLNGQQFSGTVRWDVAPFVAGNPAQGADYISFINCPPNVDCAGIGSFRVYESFDSPTGLNVGSVQLLGRIGSIIPTEFVNPTGAGFTNASVVDQLAPVPLPPALWLFGSGLLGLIGVARCKHA